MSPQCGTALPEIFWKARASIRPPGRQSALVLPISSSECRGLSGTSLRSLQETVLGVDIRVFGNIAIAAVAAEMVENETETNRSMEMLLLVKDGGSWKIVAQAWDKASAANPLPDDLPSGAISR